MMTAEPSAWAVSIVFQSVAFLGCFSLLYSGVVGECPPINNSTVGSCESNCNVMDVNSCNGSMICCDVGCGGVCTDNCSNIECENVTCPASRPIVTVRGMCCPSCAMSNCTSQCITGDPSVTTTVNCENGTIDNSVSQCDDLLVECFYSNITDALQCAGKISAVTVTSLIINQPADETLQISTLADVNLPPLQSLSIINGALRYIEDGAFNVSNLTALTNLNLSGNLLTELSYADFIGLDDLNVLDLGNNKIQQLNPDLRPLFRSLETVYLVRNNFTCDCCLEWLVQGNYIADTEYCGNSQDLSSNMSIAELTTEDICPTCHDGTFRYSNSCSRSCISSRVTCGDDYYDLKFWTIIVIGGAGGIIVATLMCLLVCFCWHCCCRKKRRRNRQETEHEMFKLANIPNFVDDLNSGKTLGFKNRLTKRFTRKEKIDSSDTENILGKRKTKHKNKKDPAWTHDNIYDMDEVDSKFEAFYSEEVTLEELLPYSPQLSLIWYELGQKLGLDTENLDTIKFAIGSLEGRYLKMLEIWLSTEGPCNWEIFLNALKICQSRSNVEQEVANDIYNVLSIKTLMELIYLPAQSKKEDTIVWESWNFFLSKAEGSKSYCKAFLKVNGLDLLLYCNQLFTSDWQLKAVFFYILDAIAQYPELQSYLMRSDVMYACKAILVSHYHPILSFTAGSVIVRMAIEGDGVWGYLIPNREEMLNSMSKAIPKWRIEQKMQDGFARGLQKLDYLVKAATNDDERISHWGIWALTNHCKTNGSLYCVQLRRSSQLAQIEQLMQDAKTPVPVKQLCNEVINCCEEYKET